jgi:hypothetical protein
MMALILAGGGIIDVLLTILIILFVMWVIVQVVRRF